MIVDSTNPRIMADNIRELARNGGGGSGSSGVSHYKVTSGAIEGTFAEVLADLTAGKLVCLDVYSDGMLAVTYFRDGLFRRDEEALTELGFYTVANKIQKGILSSDGSFTLSREYPLIVDYSTSEKDTGVKWLDGKSIYSKTIPVDFSELTKGQDNLISHLIENIDRCINISGGVKYGDDWLNFPYVTTNNAYAVRVSNVNVTNFTVSIGASFTSSNFSSGYVILYYTKTTTTKTKKTTKRKTTKGEN